MTKINEWCGCRILDREENEEEREWFKRVMCMYHWMQTNYYRNKSVIQVPQEYHRRDRPKIYD